MRLLVGVLVLLLGSVMAGELHAHHINPNIDKFGRPVGRQEAALNLQRQQLLAQRNRISLNELRRRNIVQRQRVLRREPLRRDIAPIQRPIVRQPIVNNNNVVNNNQRRRLLGNGQLARALNGVLIRDANGNTAIGNFAAAALAEEINGSEAASFIDSGALGGVINNFINGFLSR